MSMVAVQLELHGQDPVQGVRHQAYPLVGALPDSGWSFDGWSGAVSGITNPETLAMDALSKIPGAPRSP